MFACPNSAARLRQAPCSLIYTGSIVALLVVLFICIIPVTFAHPEYWYVSSRSSSCSHALPNIPNGRIVNSYDYYGNQQFQIQCNRGFSLFGNGRLRCDTSTGQWSIVGSCVVIWCSKIPSIENGYVEAGSSILGAQRNVRCFWSDKNFTAECVNSHVWHFADSCPSKGKNFEIKPFFLKI